MQVKPAARQVLAVVVAIACAFSMFECGADTPLAPQQRTSIKRLSRSMATDSTLGVSVLSLAVSRFRTSGFYPFSATVSANGTAPYTYTWYVAYCYLNDGGCYGQVLEHFKTRSQAADTEQVYITSDMSWIRATVIVGDSHTGKTLWGTDDKEVINYYEGVAGWLVSCMDDPFDKEDVMWPNYWGTVGGPDGTDGYYRIDECNRNLAHWHIAGDSEVTGSAPGE